MAYNFTQIKQGVKETEEWLKRELSTIRTGRATPAILDSVKVEAYGSDMTVTQVASVAVEDARSLRITPWDMSLAKAVEKGILLADLGLSVSADDKGVRVTFPELTSDRRGALIKIAKQKLEDAKIALRAEREKVIKDIDSRKKEGTLSEDEQFRLKTDLQKIIEDAGRVLEELFSKKEKEIGE